MGFVPEINLFVFQFDSMIDTATAARLPYVDVKLSSHYGVMERFFPENFTSATSS